jgi:CRISPR system Cascade subunit CasC
MFVELHMLQNFAPSNLNRDDTGAPKDCDFGGYRRARISSQCLKRAIRTAFREQDLLPKDNRATRTKRLVDKLTDLFQEAGKDETAARRVAKGVLEGIGLGVKDDGKTEYLLFLGEAEIHSIANLCLAHWERLAVLGEREAPAPATGAQLAARPAGREAKKQAKEHFPSDLAKALESVLDGGRAADLALFGRMLADRPEKNIDAAAQVAHAISTNKVNVEFDFYTAVDDLRPEETAGADMMGTIEFNSACFYRYANIDVGQLEENLGGDQELTRATIEAFLRASIEAIPTGKQNSMAAHNPPSLIFAVVRERGLWSLANAFVRPIWPRQDGDLVMGSVAALDAYWHQLTTLYGERGIKGKWVATLYPDALQQLRSCRVQTCGELIKQVLAAIHDKAAGAGGAA